MVIWKNGRQWPRVTMHSVCICVYFQEYISWQISDNKYETGITLLGNNTFLKVQRNVLLYIYIYICVCVCVCVCCAPVFISHVFQFNSRTITVLSAYRSLCASIFFLHKVNTSCPISEI